MSLTQFQVRTIEYRHLTNRIIIIEEVLRVDSDIINLTICGLEDLVRHIILAKYDAILTQIAFCRVFQDTRLRTECLCNRIYVTTQTEIQ